MQGFIRAAQYMADERADLGNTAEYWLDTLYSWHRQLSDDKYEPGASIGTAGFTLTKDEGGCFDLTRNILSFFPDEEPFVWTAAQK